MYLLDGQQRLTSISRAMLGEDQKHSYFFDLEVMYDELVAKSGTDLEWVGFTVKSTRKQKHFEAHQLPCESVLDAASSGAKVHTYLRELKGVTGEDIFGIAVKITTIFETIRNYQVVSHMLEKKESLEAICRIFETINNTGVKLDTFDLVVAKNYNSDFDLRELVESAEEATPDCAALKPDPELYLHSLNFYLQHQANKRFDLTRTGLLQLGRAELTQFLQPTISAYGAVYRWLVSANFKVHTGRPLVPNMLLSTLAAAEMCYPGSLDKPQVRSILTRWVLISLWNDSTYNKTRALPDLSSLMGLFSEKHPSHGNLPHPAPLVKVTPQELLEVGPASKRYVIAHTIMRIGRSTDIFGEVVGGISELEDHHILPKSICLKRKISPELMNCIGNRVLISATSNKTIAADYLPREYFESARKNSNDYELRKGLELDFIDDEMLDGANSAFDNALYKAWMLPRLHRIAHAINEYFGIAPNSP